MKKQILTKQMIQTELLTKLNQVKRVAIFLTAVTIICIVIYPFHLIGYLTHSPLDYHSSQLSPVVTMILMPLLILCLIGIVLRIYYIDLYNIKKCNFSISEEKLLQKATEDRHYYKHFEKENALYFDSGRVSVTTVVHSNSTIGDRFYIIFLKSKRYPRLAYPTKQYELNLD